MLLPQLSWANSRGQLQRSLKARRHNEQGSQERRQKSTSAAPSEDEVSLRMGIPAPAMFRLKGAGGPNWCELVRHLPQLNASSDPGRGAFSREGSSLPLPCSRFDHGLQCGSDIFPGSGLEAAIGVHPEKVGRYPPGSFG